MDLPFCDYATDGALFASLPGGQAVIDWFGFCPSFHDGALQRLEISGGNAMLAIAAFRTSTETDAQGYFILDRHAQVTLHLRGVTGLKLVGDAGSVISELAVRRLAELPDASAWETCAGPGVGDIEVAFDAAVGLHGVIYAKELAFELQPDARAASA